MPAPEAAALAAEAHEARQDLRRTARALHDEVGPLLSATGIRLHLLLMNHPQARKDVEEAVQTLDQAMENVRRLSQRLIQAFPAAGLGLQSALAKLVAQLENDFSGVIRLSYSQSVKPEAEAAVAMYEALAGVLRHAVGDRSATHIEVAVRGGRKITAQVSSDSRKKWPRALIEAQARRARPAGISLDVSTKQSTIVSICYAPRRPARG